MLDIHIISTQQRLAEKCAALETKPYIAIDTEFLRATTYWPQLCLIQVCYEGEGALIDPLAEHIDLTPFFALLQNPNIVKVFHAGQQDIEIFHHIAHFCPAPIFDTQIAAMVCGFGDAISYEQLVRSLLNERIDKSLRVTDWSKRPLSKRQMLYALSDVTHLCRLYSLLSKRLEKENRQTWVAPEFQAMSNPAHYENHPQEAWRNLKFRLTDKRQLIQLQAIAAWREQEAQRLDKPRGWILRDAVIRDLAMATANHLPLEEVRTLPKNLLRSENGKRLRHLLEQAQHTHNDHITFEASENGKSKKNEPKLAMLKLLLKVVSERHWIAPKLIATTQQIENFIAKPEDDHPINHGFRYELYGQYAQALLDGEISLTFHQGKVEIIKTKPHAQELS